MNEEKIPQPLHASGGQATIEYVLLLATIMVVFSAFMTAFHTDVVHYIFSFIGQILPGE